MQTHGAEVRSGSTHRRLEHHQAGDDGKQHDRHLVEDAVPAVAAAVLEAFEVAQQLAADVVVSDGADHQRASLSVLLSQVDVAKGPPRLVLNRRWMGMWRRRRIVRVKDEGPVHLLEMNQIEPDGRGRQKSQV